MSRSAKRNYLTRQIQRQHDPEAWRETGLGTVFWEVMHGDGKVLRLMQQAYVAEAEMGRFQRDPLNYRPKGFYGAWESATGIPIDPCGYKPDWFYDFPLTAHSWSH